MNSLFITYLLDDTSESYDKISTQIKQYDDWAKVFSRAWIVRTNKSSRRVRTELSDAIDGHGEILVINITDSAWASFRLDMGINEWMKTNV